MLFTGATLWLLHTESGLRAALGIARYWIPAGISFASVRGTLSGPLQVSGFRYRDPGIAMDLRVESASINIAPLALLARRLHIESAVISGVSLTFSAPEVPAAPKGSTTDPWNAPIAMVFDEVRITNGEARGPEGAPFVVNELLLSASWIGSGIDVRRLELESPEGEVTLSAKLDARAPRLQQLDARFRWLAGEHEWAGRLGAGGGASGAREQLDLELALEAPVSAALRGHLARAEKRGERATWQAKVSVDPFDPDPLTDAFDSVALGIDAEGDANDLSLRGELSLGKDRIRLEELVLARRAQVLEISSLRARLNEEPAAVTGSAKLALDGSAPASAQLAWDEFRLPDAWVGANFRCAGKIALTASRERFAAHATARLARGQRYSALTLRADGTRESLNIGELELTQTTGSLSVNGHVDLRQPLRWDLHSRARAFDPSLFADAWPGALDFDLDTTGKWSEAGPDANFRLARLTGKLRGRAIRGSGEISLDRDMRPSGSLELRSGGASFEAVASNAPRPSVAAKLRILELQEWRNDLRGGVSAQATASGRWPAVEMQARVEASRFRGAGMSFESATLRLDGADARAPRGKLEAAARGLELAGFRFENANAVLDGDRHAHVLKLEAQGKPLTLAFAAQGGWDRKAWSGAVQELRLDFDEVPPLQLQKPANLAIARGSLALEQACLAGGEMSLCAAATQSRKVFAIDYSVHALPLALVTALSAPQSGITVQGLLEGGGELQRAADGTLNGHATLGSTQGLLAQGKAEDGMRIEYRDFKVEANLSREAGQARVHGTLVGQGELDGIIDIAVHESDPALNGRASIELKDLAPLAWWVPQLAKMQGTGSLSVEVGGTLGTPRIAFVMSARDLDAEVPLLGLHLRDGNLTAKLHPDGSFEAEGGISSGEGSLRITGTRADSGLALALKGADFLAANIPGARVVIAPDLALTGKLDAMRLGGAVTIANADVNLEKLTIARSYSASPDVVVVEREQETRAQAMGLVADVRILLGEKVKLSGFGLESTVSGELNVSERPGEVSRASGEIRVAGTYEAFGRKLDIERGSLQYAGTELDDPQLDILAARKLQDVTAKLRVTGTAQHPKLDVFTDPAMSQTDAMSYLLTGKPASDLHGEDGQLVQSAAQSVGSVLGNRLAKKLGGKMGLVDEVGVEQNTDLGGSAFTVGKYLSPRLFVSYGIGLFEPGNAITVRYQFSERWSLEANDSPEDQHAGIRYRIEK